MDTKRDALVPVYQTSDLGRAEVVRLALENEGIRCALENELQAGFSGVLQCRLFVFESDAAVARNLIQQHEPVSSEDFVESGS